MLWKVREEQAGEQTKTQVERTKNETNETKIEAEPGINRTNKE